MFYGEDIQRITAHTAAGEEKRPVIPAAATQPLLIWSGVGFPLTPQHRRG